MRCSVTLKLVVCVCMLLFSSAANRIESAPLADDAVMRAMTDELQRSVAELQFKDLEKPYFIQYIVLDQEQYRIAGTFGALTASDTSRVISDSFDCFVLFAIILGAWCSRMRLLYDYDRQLAWCDHRSRSRKRSF